MMNISHLSEKAKLDYRLVLEAMNGSPGAYGELLLNYHDPVYFHLLKMVGNKDDADDLTIETFGLTFRNLHRYEPSNAFRTWLFKIATNHGIDFIRKRKIERQNIGNTDDKQIPSEAELIGCDDPGPEDILIVEQKNELMHSVVDKLKPNYRQLIEMRYFGEYSYAEISDKTGIPLGTVKARLFRARELLFNTLKNFEKCI